MAFEGEFVVCGDLGLSAFFEGCEERGAECEVVGAGFAAVLDKGVVYGKGGYYNIVKGGGA